MFSVSASALNGSLCDAPPGNEINSAHFHGAFPAGGGGVLRDSSQERPGGCSNKRKPPKCNCNKEIFSSVNSVLYIYMNKSGYLQMLSSIYILATSIIDSHMTKCASKEPNFLKSQKGIYLE